MGDFQLAYELSRGRFDAEVMGLSHAQLNWSIYSGALTIAKMAVHLAGVETSFALQLSGVQPDEDLVKLVAAATEGVVNQNPFPFSEEELTPELVADAMGRGRAFALGIFASTDPSVRSKPVKSALGPMIDGEGAMTRLAVHPFYHQGQAYLIKNSPGFPRE